MPRSHFITNRVLERILEMRSAVDANQRAVYSIADIGTELGLSDNAIRWHTRHIPEPPGGWKSRGRKKFDHARAKRLKLVYGMSYGEIAASIGVRKAAVWNAVNGRPQTQKSPPLNPCGERRALFTDSGTRRCGKASNAASHPVGV